MLGGLYWLGENNLDVIFYYGNRMFVNVKVIWDIGYWEILRFIVLYGLLVW